MNFWIRTHWGPWWWLSAPQCRLLLCKPWSLQSPSPGGPLAADHDPWLCRGWGYTLWTNRASETGTAPSNIMTTFQWGQDQWSVRWMTLNTNHPSHSRSVGKQMLFSPSYYPACPQLSTHPFLQREFLDHREGSEPLSSHRKWDIPSYHFIKTVKSSAESQRDQVQKAKEAFQEDKVSQDMVHVIVFRCVALAKATGHRDTTLMAEDCSVFCFKPKLLFLMSFSLI